MTRVLAIETSCDETAIAVVEDGRRIRSNQVASQVEAHSAFGGVVPEVASRQHLLWAIPVLERALAEAEVTWRDLSAIAVTMGPGLAGSLLVGVNLAKGLALAQELPLLGVNHLEGHIYANWLDPTFQPAFPLLCLLVSGAHSDLLLMRGHGDYQILGRTRDDAAGEAFDKAARILGLGYPGGPAIQQAAIRGNPRSFPLPRAWLEGSHDFSFSGMKTALLRLVQRLEEEGGSLPTADLAAAFQLAVVEVLAEKTARAAEQLGVKQILLGGGVAANVLLREALAAKTRLPLHYPEPVLCTDNAAMIAAAAHFRLLKGQRTGLDLDVYPNLRLG
jgi:N6-L-threonylcarbamoyladenine synthase